LEYLVSARVELTLDASDNPAPRMTPYNTLKGCDLQVSMLIDMQLLRPILTGIRQRKHGVWIPIPLHSINDDRLLAVFHSISSIKFFREILLAVALDILATETPMIRDCMFAPWTQIRVPYFQISAVHSGTSGSGWSCGLIR